MACGAGHGLMIEDADHDGINVTRQHTRGVGERLAASQLHFLRGQQDRFAAKLPHGNIERDACTR